MIELLSWREELVDNQKHYPVSFFNIKYYTRSLTYLHEAKKQLPNLKVETNKQLNVER